MKKEWILQSRETRRFFGEATWVPLRASCKEEPSALTIKDVGFQSEFFGCGSVAFPPEHRARADSLGWQDIGIIHSPQPYAYGDGHYSAIDQYQYDDKLAIGVELVFEHPQPVVGKVRWILNPDLVVALRLIKEGQDWVRPEENFVVVAREAFDDRENHCLIEIKREFLIDYLAARGLALRLSYYRQRLENIYSLETSEYSSLVETQEERNNGRFELRIRTLNSIFGGSWSSLRLWRTDVDEDDDAPALGPEREENTGSEVYQGSFRFIEGTQVEGEFWRNEWIDHAQKSVRVRGDIETSLPQFIVETDGTRIASSVLNDEDIGRWLWFRSDIAMALLSLRGFSLDWYTAQTGGFVSTSGYPTHFGVNSADLITVYAYDIARLPAWEQHLWASHNVVPEGKVASELLAAQVQTQPANSSAAEDVLFATMRLLEDRFRTDLNTSLFVRDIDDRASLQQVCRFASKDQPSLLRLAKEIVRVFSDRLNIRELRKLSKHENADKLGSNKLLESVVARSVGEEKARVIFGPIVGAYDMRVGDAHPTSSDLSKAIGLVGIDQSRSHLRQGEQLIQSFGRSLWQIGHALFGHPEHPEG